MKHDNVLSIQFNNALYLLSDQLIAKGIFISTVTDCPEEDLKAMLSHNMKDIPQGTTLKIISAYENLFGKWLQVEWDGRLYNINPKNVDVKGIV